MRCLLWVSRLGVGPKLCFEGRCSSLVLLLKIIELPSFLLQSCYGSPSSPSMVRTSTYSSASPTTDAAITADITRWKTRVRLRSGLKHNLKKRTSEAPFSVMQSKLNTTFNITIDTVSTRTAHDTFYKGRSSCRAVNSTTACSYVWPLHVQYTCKTKCSLTAAVSVNTYWLPIYEQANAATTVIRKLNTVTTTAFTDRTGERQHKFIFHVLHIYNSASVCWNCDTIISIEVVMRY